MLPDSSLTKMLPVSRRQQEPKSSSSSITPSFPSSLAIDEQQEEIILDTLSPELKAIFSGIEEAINRLNRLAVAISYNTCQKVRG
jgi:hypothetical protein